MSIPNRGIDIWGGLDQTTCPILYNELFQVSDLRKYVITNSIVIQINIFRTFQEISRKLILILCVLHY